MPKPTDFRLAEVTAATERIAYRTPIKFGGRVVNDAVLLDVTCHIESRDGQRGTGHGSMPLGNAWAWPSATLGGDRTLLAMEALGAATVAAANEFQEYGDPLEITHHLESLLPQLAADVARSQELAEGIPMLAALVVASPLMAAIHDAFGKMLNRNSYDLLGADFVNHSLEEYLGDDFRGEYLDRYTLRTPKPQMPLYHLIGALDPLTDAELPQRLDDGLPETLPEWIAADGLTHMKIKLNGDDLAWDVERVVRIDAAAAPAQQARGCSTWHYSLDFNERCENVDYVLEFLARLREQAPAALDRVQYIEQPTHRDLRANPDNRMHAAAKIKPVVIDESLIDLDSLLLAREMGYTGVALKACKGHTGALLMGAAAQKYELFLCVQDLTCPGYSFLHSASLAARIPTIAAIEGNGRQYCPAGNVGWSDRYPGMFEITDGSVGTAALTGPGLF